MATFKHTCSWFCLVCATNIKNLTESKRICFLKLNLKNICAHLQKCLKQRCVCVCASYLFVFMSNSPNKTRTITTQKTIFLFLKSNFGHMLCTLYNIIMKSPLFSPLSSLKKKKRSNKMYFSPGVYHPHLQRLPLFLTNSKLDNK